VDNLREEIGRHLAAVQIIILRVLKGMFLELVHGPKIGNFSLYERGLQDITGHPPVSRIFCHCQDIQIRYKLYAVLIIY